MADEVEDEMETPPAGYQGQITLKVQLVGLCFVTHHARARQYAGCILHGMFGLPAGADRFVALQPQDPTFGSTTKVLYGGPNYVPRSQTKPVPWNAPID